MWCYVISHVISDYDKVWFRNGKNTVLITSWSITFWLHPKGKKRKKLEKEKEVIESPVKSSEVEERVSDVSMASSDECDQETDSDFCAEQDVNMESESEIGSEIEEEW